MTENNVEYTENCNFVLNNLDITTDLLTQSRLDHLMIKEYKDDMPFSIFCFAYNAYQANKNKSFEIDPKELVKVFQTYQAYLNLEIFSRQGITKFESVRIFDFDNYNDNAEVVFNQ